MCDGCWAEYDSPTIDNPNVRLAAQLVHQLYEDEGEITGGMLHVQLDDWNIDDADPDDPTDKDAFDDPFPQWLLDSHNRQPLDVEREIVSLFRRMTVEERASALALVRGYWE